MDRFPRTAAEFAENGRIVVMRCNCGADSTWIRPENLIQRLGSGFDLYTGFVELLDTFRCDSAGSGGTPPSSTFSSNHSVQSAWRSQRPAHWSCLPSRWAETRQRWAFHRMNFCGTGIAPQDGGGSSADAKSGHPSGTAPTR